MKSLNIHEAKNNLSRLLAKLEVDCEPIVICRNGHPVADLVPHRHISRLKIHPLLSKITIRYNPTEPLTKDEWPKKYR